MMRKFILILLIKAKWKKNIIDKKGSWILT